MSENPLRAAVVEAVANDTPPPKNRKSKTAPPKRTAKPKGKTVLIGGHFPPEVLKQLKLIAVEDETTNQALLEEALNLLFAKKGKTMIKNL